MSTHQPVKSADLLARPDYAKSIANKLLSRTKINKIYKSGLFLSGIRRVGKSTFVKSDLMPELARQNAIPVYVDLFRASKDGMSTTEAIEKALDKKLEEIKSQQTPSALSRFSKIMSIFSSKMEKKSVERGGSIGFNIGVLKAERFSKRVSEAAEPTAKVEQDLHNKITGAIKQHNKDIVLIIDEAQEALALSDGFSTLKMLKSVRDDINVEGGDRPRFLVLATGSHRGMLHMMATRVNQPFHGAHLETFQTLGKEYVEWELKNLSNENPEIEWPSLEAAEKGFSILGSRPEFFLRAMSNHAEHPTADPDNTFIATCFQISKDVNYFQKDEILKLCGDLECAIFDRVCMSDESTKVMLTSKEALKYYSELTNSVVTAQHVQFALDKKLVRYNFVYAVGGVNGHYNAVDESFRDFWLKDRGLVRDQVQALADHQEMAHDAPPQNPDASEATEMNECDGDESTQPRLGGA